MLGPMRVLNGQGKIVNGYQFKNYMWMVRFVDLVHHLCAISGSRENLAKVFALQKVPKFYLASFYYLLSGQFSVRSANR